MYMSGEWHISNATEFKGTNSLKNVQKYNSKRKIGIYFNSPIVTTSYNRFTGSCIFYATYFNAATSQWVKKTIAFINFTISKNLQLELFRYCIDVCIKMKESNNRL